MLVESIIGAAGFAVAVAVAIAVSPYPLGTEIGLASWCVLAFALLIWRRLAFLGFAASMILTAAVMAGIDSGPLAVAGNVAMLAAILAALAASGVCLAWGLNKIYETNDPRFQIMIPILFAGLLALSAWQGLWQGFRLWFLAVLGFGTLIMFCFELWRLLKWRRAE